MQYNLVSSIVGGKWLIEPEFAQANLGLVFSILRGNDSIQSIKEKESKVNAKLAASPKLIAPSWSEGFRSQEIDEGSIAVVSVLGAVMKNSGWCNTGSMEMAQWIKEADENPKISSILLMIDSPGGMVDGTSTLGDAIKAAQTKTYAFIEDGTAASAAYWIASSCDEIWSSHSINMVGSIGVYVTLANWKKYYESEGLEIKEVYSQLSTEKNKMYYDALEDNFKPLQEGSLDPVAKAFIQHVTDQRGDKLNVKVKDPFKGGIYTSDIALQIGLIDRIGSFEELLNEIQSTSNSNQFSNSNTNQMKFKSAWAAIMTAIGFSSVASEDEAPNVTEERLELLNGSLEAANSELATVKDANTQLQADLDKANADLSASQKEVSTLQAEKEQLEEKVADYGKKAGATHSTTKKKVENADEEENEHQKAIDELPHNQALNGNPLFN